MHRPVCFTLAFTMNIPDENDVGNSELIARVDRLEIELKEQEHRIPKILLNIIKHGFDSVDTEKRRAVWVALIGYLLRQRSIAIIISLASVFGFIITTYILLSQNALLEKQNRLIEQQNIRLDQQTYLQEAERRSSLVFQLGNILDGLDKEVKEDVGEKKVRDISPELRGRIISLSRLLKPYKYLENDALIPVPLSPERGQLLVSILNSELDVNTLRHIYTNSDFSYADLTRSNLVHFDFQQAKLFNSDLSGSYILKSDFFAAKMSSTKLDNSTIQESSFQGADLAKSSFLYCNLSFSTFLKADLQKANLQHTTLFGVTFEETNLKDVDLEFARVSNRGWFDELSKMNPQAEELTNIFYVDSTERNDPIIGTYFEILRRPSNANNALK